MKAFMIVFMPARNGHAAPGSSLALRSGGRISSVPARADTARSRQLSDGDQMTPPFWTWFIENPRRYSA